MSWCQRNVVPFWSRSWRWNTRFSVGFSLWRRCTVSVKFLWKGVTGRVRASCCQTPRELPLRSVGHCWIPAGNKEDILVLLPTLAFWLRWGTNAVEDIYEIEEKILYRAVERSITHQRRFSNWYPLLWENFALSYLKTLDQNFEILFHQQSYNKGVKVLPNKPMFHWLITRAGTSRLHLLNKSSRIDIYIYLSNVIQTQRLLREISH